MPEMPSLSLLTPALADSEAFAPALTAACAAAPVAAVILHLEPADERALINRVKRLAAVAHEHGAALLLVEPERPELDAGAVAVRGGADGLHARSPERVRPLRERLGSGRQLGVGGLRAKHDAMEAGEAGADYVLFGEPRPDGSVPALDGVAERAAWWAEIFEIPCLAFAPSLAAVPRLAATGAEFVALGDAVWAHPEGPAAAVAEATAALRAGGKVPA
jgi:thiamine-phosphate pyrophosphorylase